MKSNEALAGSTGRLGVELTLPFHWQRVPPEGQPLETLLEGSRLLLKVLLLTENPPLRETDAEKWAERLDAKMDLILHLLAMSLNREAPKPIPRRLWLTPEGMRWDEAAADLATGDRLLLALHISALPIPLRLPARVSRREGSHIEAHFDLPEELNDAWQQWLFRQHRRAVHAAREGR